MNYRVRNPDVCCQGRILIPATECARPRAQLCPHTLRPGKSVNPLLFCSFLGGQPQSAFTLIELILVMAILTMAVSVTAPTLANFFRGRTLDSEARRLIALTHSGQNRAISEGIPIDLWIDADNRTVGLDAEPSFEKTDPKAVEFTIDSGLQIEVIKPAVVAPVKMTFTSRQANSTASVPRVNLTHPSVPTIRFLPDGTISESSPQKLRLSGRDDRSLWMALSQDKLSYEIRTSDK